MMKAIKFLLFCFNLIFVIAGLAVFILGIVIKAGYSDYFGVLPDNVFTAPRIFIAVGLITFVVAFLGCCGAMRESRWLLFFFMISIGIIIVLEISAAIAAYALRADLQSAVVGKMNASIQQYDKPDNGGVTDSWNVLQRGAKCCGGEHNYTDWKQRYDDSNDTHVHLPRSCCVNETVCGEFDGDWTTWIPRDEAQKTVHQVGCLAGIENICKEHIGALGGTAVGIAVVEIVGIVFAYLLFRKIGTSYETV